MVVERSVELYTYLIDITQQQKYFRNFNSAKYTFSKFRIPQSAFRKVHLVWLGSLVVSVSDPMTARS